MAKPGTVTGWKLPSDERSTLLHQFKPKYDNVVADHVTLRTGATPQTPLPSKVEAQIVGYANDSNSLECLVVSINGTTDRPDGSIYHITWSLGPGRRARESNQLLLDKGWTPVEKPIPVQLEPARF